MDNNLTFKPEVAHNPLRGCSDNHQSNVKILEKLANTDAEILIQGPSGTGKELYALLAHQFSHRSQKPFIPVNCATLSKDLLENELFGHIGGAFTGAKSKSEGLVTAAEGGTLFFDELDCLTMPCQVKLLRFLQDKYYRRLGENYLHKADVRIIAASNANLEELVRQEKFRRDLFFRLRVVPIQVKSLAERPEDLTLLIKVFINDSAQKYNLPKIRLSTSTLKILHSYSWPGNIRELENCISYLTCFQLDRAIEPEDLPLLQNDIIQCNNLLETDISYNGNLSEQKQSMIATFECRYLKNALKLTNGNVSAAARNSGKDRRAFFELLKKYRIEPSDYRNAQQNTKSNKQTVS